mmetsp:Transcript_8463/g.13758  ORF Transcript_8463/g.13758 Transcript_8463/m.13758 type:complete len:192 (+) Transcript_8463:168-743(+)
MPRRLRPVRGHGGIPRPSRHGRRRARFHNDTLLPDPFLTHTPLPLPTPYSSQAKLLSVEFKQISTSERAKMDQLAVEDKERYQAEMEDYEPPSESDSDSDSDAPKKKKKAKKKKKDPNAPKRNMSSFFLYSNATRNDVKTANPEAKFGEIAQIISRHFKALPEEEREYWNEKAAEDKERYLRAKAIYEGEE